MFARGKFLPFSFFATRGENLTGEFFSLFPLTCCVANVWLVANETKIALLRYLQVVPRRGELPDPDGPPSAIEAANAAVSAAREGAVPEN